MTTWVIPPSTRRWLDQIPRDRPVAMLIRHSVRDQLPPGAAGDALPITEAGRRLATALGETLGSRLRSVRTSPLVRTMQTSACLVDGAGVALEPLADTLLGAPGAFVVDDRAGAAWDALGHEGVMAHFVADPAPLPGCAAPEPAARFLVHHMLSQALAPGVHAFVTHDSLITATVAWMLGRPMTMADWPWYLEAAFFWADDDGVHTAWRTWHERRGAPLVALTETDVVAHARREVAATVGLDCPARFFLAGGAFKTLLTGRPPRDLDIWAPSDGDRQILMERLLQRGAVPAPPQPYTQAFALGARTIELPLKTTPDTLHERLLSFDLGLSAIGAEHLPGDQWRAEIHPLALRSVAQRQVLLLDELRNWRHALTTLERMRRYADELGYEAPQAEQDRIWAMFLDQPPEVRQEMVARFEQTSRRDQGVAEEIRCRFP